MKYLNLIFLLLLSSSCCGTRSNVPQLSNLEVEDVSKTEFVSIQKDDNAEVTILTDTEIMEAAQGQSNSSEKETEKSILEANSEQSEEAFNHGSWDDLLKKYVSNSGNVNYKGFKNDRQALKIYLTSLGENMPSESWRREDKLAYWINAYNAMTVDLIIRNYPLSSIKDINDPWKQRLWELGKKWYNLDEIEHQILRKMNEPRIHFGIVCASYSCPKLINEAFTAKDLERQLTVATKEFLADRNRNNISENDLKLSKIFQWFAKDFKKNGTLIDFLNQYSDVKISSNAKKRFKDYNWDLNE